MIEVTLIEYLMKEKIKSGHLREKCGLHFCAEYDQLPVCRCGFEWSGTCEDEVRDE